ncbi:MAG: hypothetical protein MUF81_03710 [Verrucomicrobia bacterium]|jgi:hypothetical protein|nr:hypothetical protein [Verrucomicrobiota bacterium]
MSSDGLRFTPFLIATGLALAAILPANGEGRPPRRGRSIQFSEPRSSVVSSNVNELRTKPTTLNDLEQALKKPFDVFSPGDDPIARFTTPPVPRMLPSPAQSRRMKELLEKRNEWIFLAPEDYYAPGLTAEKMFNLPEYSPSGEEKTRKNPMERYFDRMDKLRAGAQGAATNYFAGSETLNARPTDAKPEGLGELSFGGQQSPLSSGLSGLEKTTQRLSPGDASAFSAAAAEPTTARSFSDLFGFGNADPTGPASEQSRTKETRMQEFKQLLETRSLTPPNPGAGKYNPLSSSPATSPSTVSPPGFDVFSSTGARGALSPLPPGLNSLAPLSGLPSWQTPLPTPQTPRMTLPPPKFNIPQRKF